MSLEGNAEKNMLLNKLTGKIRYIPELDDTLSYPDKAASAKAAGDAIRELRETAGDLARRLAILEAKE